MNRIFESYDGDKRKRDYKEYLTNWSLTLGLLNNDKNVSEESVLIEERTHEDYYKIIMYLGKIIPISDIVRNIVENLNIKSKYRLDTGIVEDPVHDINELMGIIPIDNRTTYDVREIISRIVDGSRFHEFKACLILQ